VTLAFFALVNFVVERLEREQVLETGRTDQASQLTGRADHVSQVLEERLWREDSGQWTRTDYADDFVPSRDFAVQKADGFRAFVLGASFAEGTPYPLDAAQGEGGGIASFVEAELRRRNPGRVIEVVNAAASGRNSTWVRDVAREVLEYDPDVLIVASCNNEGAPAPGWINEYLRRQGAYRMMQKLLRPDARPNGERSWYTPQDLDTKTLREQFAFNIRTIVNQARDRGTKVLLATLPINLRYAGFELGHLIDHKGVEPGGREPGGSQKQRVGPTAWSDPNPGSVPAFFADSDPCHSGIVAFEAGYPVEAAGLLRACAVTSHGSAPPDGGSAGPEGLWDYVAAAEIAGGHSSEEARRRLEWRFGACIGDAVTRYHEGDLEGAVASLEGCDDIEEALRWKGLALAASGEVTSARAVLRQAVELLPRNAVVPRSTSCYAKRRQGKIMSASSIWSERPRKCPPMSSPVRECLSTIAT